MIVCLIWGVNSVVVARSFHRKRAGLGGADKIVEVDETYVGGKAKNQVKRETAPKEAVLSLVERVAELSLSTSPISPRRRCAL